MKVAMCSSVFILAFLMTQVLSAPVALEERAIAIASTELGRHRQTIGLLKHAKLIDQDASYGECETCSELQCPSDCLDILRDQLAPAIEQAQKRFGLQPVDGLLTIELMEILYKPLCGDNDSGITVHRTKRWAKLGESIWDVNKMPLQISFRNYLNQFTREEQENIALECARMWAEPTPLSFQLAPHGQKGHIDIEFKYIDGKWNTVGLGLSPTPWGTLGRDYSYLQLDNSEIWKLRRDSNRGGISLKWAMCHEMGHNLALSHSTDNKAIMYPAGIGQEEDKLSNDDYRGITSLYRGGGNGKTIFGRARPGQQPSAQPSPPTRRPAPPTRRPTPPTRRPTPPPTRRTPPPTRRTPPPRWTPRPTTRPPPSTNTWRPKRLPPPGHVPRYRDGTYGTRRPVAPQPQQYWYYDPSYRNY